MSAATTDLDVSCCGRAKRQLARGLARAAWPDGGETMSRVPRLARQREAGWVSNYSDMSALLRRSGQISRNCSDMSE